MMVAGNLPVSLAEVQAYVRAETGEEEALLVGFVRTAAALCEEFVGLKLLDQAFEETLSVQAGWARLRHLPVRQIQEVMTIESDGSETALSTSDYAVDIDADGRGWVRLAGHGGRVRVSGRVGMASEANGLPEPLRQGIIRMVSHLFSNRDDCMGEPPAAVTALWRPYRRMAL